MTASAAGPYGGANASMRSPSPRTKTARRLENSRKPSMPWWRPEPLWPMPPKGSEGSAPWAAVAFTHAPPEVVRRRTSSATASSFGEHVQRERALAGVDVADRLVEVVVGLDRQDRA